MLKFAVLSFALLPALSFAQAVSAPSAFDRFMGAATGVGKQTVNFGSNGQLLTSQGVPQITPDGGSGVKASQTGNLSNPQGVPVPVAATGRISNVDIAKAIGRAAAKIVTPVAATIAIAELIKELGGKWLPDGTMTKPDPLYCGVAPCFEHQYTASHPWSRSGQAACAAGMSSTSDPKRSNPVFYAPSRCNFSATYASGEVLSLNVTMLSRSVAVSPAPPAGTTAEVPMTMTELEDLIAQKSGWPSSSTVARALAEAVAVTGDKLKPSVTSVTGPATSPGPTTRTVNPNGTTSTTNVTNNHNYAGPVVTTTTVSTTTVTNTSTGAVESVTTRTEDAPAPVSAPEPAITCGLPGTPACKIDETGTKADAGTSFDAAKTDLDTVKTTSATAIDGAASIAAPAWSFSFQLPTGCAPYVTGIKGVILNVCQYQSTIHDLLSMIWAAATAFGMIGMVGRTIRES